VIQDADASQLGQLLTLSAQTLAMSILARRWGWAGFFALQANNFCREDSGHWWQQASVVRNSCSGIHPISAACPACRP